MKKYSVPIDFLELLGCSGSEGLFCGYAPAKSGNDEDSIENETKSRYGVPAFWGAKRGNCSTCSPLATRTTTRAASRSESILEVMPFGGVLKAIVMLIGCGALYL